VSEQRPAPPENVDARIAAAIQAERTFILSVVGEAIGQMLAEQHREHIAEFKHEVERLWHVVSELQGTLRAFGRVERIARGEPFSDSLN
jgi:hypothetical protein